MKTLPHFLTAVLLALTASAANSNAPEKDYGFGKAFRANDAVRMAEVATEYAHASVTILDRGFFHELRKAVLADGAAQVAALVNYPIIVYLNEGDITIRSESEFTRRYKEIVTPALKEAVRQAKPEDLWKNWQGVMINNGAIWFTEFKPKGVSISVTKVTTINLSDLALKGSNPTPEGAPRK